MAICKDCLHFEVCKLKHRKYFAEETDVEYLCNQFKPKADYTEVVHCEHCKHSYELAPHSEISSYYRHCNLWRGEETKNVWHKYKKYYADYSIVEPTDFCSYGEKESEVQGE